MDVIFADVAQPDQARIVALNAEYFLKNGGHVLISIKASCIDSTAAPATVFAREVQYLRENKFKPIEQVTLEPYERDHAMVVGAWLSLDMVFAWQLMTSFLFDSRVPTTQVDRCVVFS